MSKYNIPESSKNKYVLYKKSVELSDIPVYNIYTNNFFILNKIIFLKKKPQKDIVRGETLLYGLFLYEDDHNPNKIKSTLLTHMDIK